MSKHRLNVYSDYIKKHSLGGFKTGIKFPAYFYIRATIASLISSLFLIFGANTIANFLILPLAILISNPVAWATIGIIFIVASGVAMLIAKPLFHLAKDLISRKKEKNEEKGTELKDLQGKTPKGQARQKTPDRDSVIVTLEVDKDYFATATEKGDYNYKLTTTDIRDIAESKYVSMAHRDKKGLKNASEGVIFACPDNITSSLEKEIQEYKNEVAQGDNNLIFISIFNINDNHWVTLTIVCSSNKKPRARSNNVGSNCSSKEGKELKRRLSLGNEDNNTFTAYYCDSFGNELPSEVSKILKKTLGIDSSNVGISETKQQKDEDTWNCGIFALENAKKITDMLKAGGSFDAKLKYILTPEQLIIKRKELAKALKKDDRSCSSPCTSLDSGRVSDSESTKTQRTVVKTYDTVGDGNCFFHAVFGEEDSSNTYRAERAQEMRLEWHKFLSQFKSLDDQNMPEALKKQLQTALNMFLNEPGDLTGRLDMIKELAEQTNQEIVNIQNNVKKLVNKVVSSFNVSRDMAISDLKEYAKALYPELTEEQYNTTYNSEAIENSFLNDEGLYKAYLEAISSQRYYIFAEEIPILASLAGIDIEFYAKYTDNRGKVVTSHSVFLPNPNMINGGYERSVELWRNKKKETINLKPDHYERAEIVEIEPSFLRNVQVY